MRNSEGIARAIQSAGTVAVCCHINPDGDTIGSALAMRLALISLGKEVQVFCQDKVPDSLLFLPGAKEIRMPDRTDCSFDLMLSVDASAPDRLGSCWEIIFPVSVHTAQMDHHGTNPLFMEVNSVDGSAAATCTMILEQMRAMKVALTREMAECLYTGISTDTGNFSFNCTDAESFRAMSDLMEAGLPLADLSFLLFRQRSRAQLLLLGKAIASLRFEASGELAVMKLTRADFEACGAKSEHADTIVNYGLETIGTKMALLAREDDSGRIKCSLRAVPPLCVDGLANRLGGGGHPQAAGISMDGILDVCAARVAEEMVRALEEARS